MTTRICKREALQAVARPAASQHLGREGQYALVLDSTCVPFKKPLIPNWNEMNIYNCVCIRIYRICIIHTHTHIYIYIYTYTLRCWGSPAHMWDATQLGWGWWHSWHLHACEMLRNWWGGVGMMNQLTVSLCLFPQASNLPRLPVFLKPHAKYLEKHMIFDTNLTSWTCCQREKTAGCQPLPFPTSFKFSAPASVFEATRKRRGKTDDFWNKSYIIDIIKISQCLFYHSKMQFFAFCMVLVMTSLEMRPRGRKKIDPHKCTFCFQEQHAKIRVSPQWKPHFSYYCPYWHTSVPENLGTVPYIYIYICKNDIIHLSKLYIIVELYKNLHLTRPAWNPQCKSEGSSCGFTVFHSPRSPSPKSPRGAPSVWSSEWITGTFKRTPGIEVLVDL